MCPLRVTLSPHTHTCTRSRFAMDAALKSHLMLNSRLCVCQPYRLFGLRPIYARIPHSPAFCTLGVINFSTSLPAGREGKEACKILRPRANATRSVVQSSATHNRYIYLVPRFANVQRQGLDRANNTTNRRDMMLHQRREHTGGARIQPNLAHLMGLYSIVCVSALATSFFHLCVRCGCDYRALIAFDSHIPRKIAR